MLREFVRISDNKRFGSKQTERPRYPCCLPTYRIQDQQQWSKRKGAAESSDYMLLAPL